jgi:ADP-heptose:LPS heptosyltransferase
MKVEKMLQREISTLPMDVRSRTDCENVAVLLQFADGTYHHILPSHAVSKAIIEACAEHIGAADIIIKAENAACKHHDDFAKTVATHVAADELPDAVIFKNRQAIGDILCMTGAVRDFKNAYPNVRVNVITTAMHIWDHNPALDRSLNDHSKILEVGPGFGTNRSNAWNINLIDAFRMDFENKLKVRIEKGPVRPDIWMTKEEYERPPIIEGPYWIIINGGEPGWPSKQYPYWQEVVDQLSGKIKFVQLGLKGHPWPLLDGVVNMVGKTEDRNTGIRDMFNLFLHAQGSIGLVSMHMHLSAAFGNPCVVVAGAREPAWFTQYFGHQYLQTNGTLRCGLHTACWKCKIEGCQYHAEAPRKQIKGKDGNLLPVPKCVDIISPDEVVDAVLKYYQGGRLEFGKKVPNKFFSNIAKAPSTVVSVPRAAEASKEDNDFVTSAGFTWGGGSLTDRDWVFIKGLLKAYDVKTVLEFGAGLSTLLFQREVDRVISYETSPGWIKKISSLIDPNRGRVLHWNGEYFKMVGMQCDLAFVDGPSGGQSREFSTKISSELADLVVVHDAGRGPEKEWQQKYLAEEFDMISKGGHRCHFWVRKDSAKNPHRNKPSQLVAAPLRIENPAARAPDVGLAMDAGCDLEDESVKTAIMITTCRGYGGSERSSIQLMRMLQEQGYEVYLCPTGNISGEYRANIPAGVIVMNWEQLKEAAVDLVVFYTSDTIWGFKEQRYCEVMPTILADRKVMVLNYQLGGAGIVPWTIGWDLYMFLNTTKEKEFLALAPGSNTKVLAPATDLTKFFEVVPDYNSNLRLIRHSSQGDAKHPDYTNDMILDILGIYPGTEFYFMPARSDCMEHPAVHRHRKNVPPVYEFLSLGNCFFYHLPPGYQDQGPKVICEAMAAGLPVIADNRYGAKDRVTPDTGWLINSPDEIPAIIREIKDNPGLLEKKGKAARERAKQLFVMERWIDAIVGEEVNAQQLS